MKTDYSKIFGGSILSFVEETIGPIQNIEKPYLLSSKAKTKAYVADVRNDPDYKVLFTLGLFAHHMKECFICLPASWPLPHYYFQSNLLNKKITNAPYLPETLPLDILTGISETSIRKNTKFEITEGTFLDKTKSPWTKFDWPEKFFGVAMIDYNWNTPENEVSEDTKDSTVRLFTLAPVTEDKKKLTAEWFNIRRYEKWHQFVFPVFSDISMVVDMNKAVINRNWDEVTELINNGVNVNRGVYEEHPMWGDVVTYSYLENVMREKDSFNMVKLLIEKGAKISSETLPLIAGCSDIQMFDYFINLGCDINAVDNVGYTALNRAIAFKNEPLIKHIISLGGSYRVQKFDNEDTLQKLSEMGAKLDESAIK